MVPFPRVNPDRVGVYAVIAPNALSADACVFTAVATPEFCPDEIVDAVPVNTPMRRSP